MGDLPSDDEVRAARRAAANLTGWRASELQEALRQAARIDTSGLRKVLREAARIDTSQLQEVLREATRVDTSQLREVLREAARIDTSELQVMLREATKIDTSGLQVMLREAARIDTSGLQEARRAVRPEVTRIRDAMSSSIANQIDGLARVAADSSGLAMSAWTDAINRSTAGSALEEFSREAADVLDDVLGVPGGLADPDEEHSTAPLDDLVARIASQVSAQVLAGLSEPEPSEEDLSADLVLYGAKLAAWAAVLGVAIALTMVTAGTFVTLGVVSVGHQFMPKDPYTR